MRLSVIVPIYKVEKYLRKCVDSILNQNLPSDDYEIILVDDGSPDSCGKIVDEYASAHSNVVAIHQENGGLSKARNAGLMTSRGKYVQFVDSDDYLAPDSLAFLISKMETENLEVLRFNYQNVNENYEVIEPYKDVKPFVDYTDEICDGKTFLNYRLGYACYAVQFIIRRQILTGNGVFFKPGIRFEDTEWTPRMLAFASRVTSVSKVAYYYLLRLGSITNTNSIDAKRRILEDKFNLIECLKSQMRNVCGMFWYDGMISLTVISALTMVSIEFYDERGFYITRLKHMEVFPLSLYHISKRSAIKVRMANISAGAFCIMHHLKNLL